MRKKVLKVLIGLLAVLLVALPVYAASSATITVVESSGNSYTMIGVASSMDNTYLASHGFISATGLDVDLNSLPFMLASDRTLIATALTANGTVLLPYTTGNTPASAFHVLTGYDGYITVLDAAALEPGNNFEFDISGYIDTSAGSDKNLVYKDEAFRIFIGGSGDITSNMFGWINPTGNTASGWSNPTNVYDDNTGTYASYNTFSNTWTSFLEVTHSALDTRKVRVWASGAAPNVLDINVYYNDTWNDVYTENGPWNQWVTIDLGEIYSVTSMRIRIYNTASGDGYIFETDFGGYSPSVTATGVSSGEHIVKITADGVDLKIFIDTVEEDSTALGAATVPDNGNDWIINQNNVMPYMDYYKHTIASTLITSYQPAAIIGGQTYSTGTVTGTTGTATITGTTTTWVNNMVGGLMLISGDSTYYTISSVTDNTHLVLTTDLGTSPAGATYDMYPKLIDQTGGDQPGLITWGTNPAGVATDVGALLPSVVVTPATGIPDVSDLVPEYNPTISSGVEGANFPLYDLFKGLMADFQANGGPEITMPYFWKIVATIIALILGTAVLVATKNIVIGVGAYAGLIAIPTAMGILDWYYIIWYVIGAIAVSLLVTKWTSSSI